MYVLWDIHSLSHYGDVRIVTPEEITDWHPELYASIQSLDPYTRKRQWPLEAVPSTEPVINIDSD